MSDERWPRTADKQEIVGGNRVRTWYVGQQTDCTHVEVWMPDRAVSMFFSAKGCVDVSKFSNGATPEAPGNDDEQSMHVCDVPEFASTLMRGAELAKDRWRKI